MARYLGFRTKVIDATKYRLRRGSSNTDKDTDFDLQLLPSFWHDLHGQKDYFYILSDFLDYAVQNLFQLEYPEHLGITLEDYAVDPRARTLDGWHKRSFPGNPTVYECLVARSRMWQGIQADIKKEEMVVLGWHNSGRSKPMPSLPVTDAVREFGIAIDMDVRQLFRQIEAYSMRCMSSHDAIKTHIQNRDAGRLATKLWRDRKMLKESWFFDTDEGKTMMEAMNGLIASYFRKIVEYPHHDKHKKVFTIKWRIQPRLADTWERTGQERSVAF